MPIISIRILEPGEKKGGWVGKFIPGKDDSMSDDQGRDRAFFPVPGEFLKKVFEHVERTGQPLLRGVTPADEKSLSAWRSSGGEYDLELDEGPANPSPQHFSGEVDGIENWGVMADYLGMETEELLAALRERGYPWLPREEELEEGQTLDNCPLHEPHDVVAYMQDQSPEPAVPDVLEGVPKRFRWDGSAPDPGAPPLAADARVWQEEPGLISGWTQTTEARGGVGEKVTWVPSAISLSCLQYALDMAGKGVGILLRN